MAFFRHFMNACYVFLYVSFAILNTGCNTAMHATPEDNNYYSTWEPKHSGKYRFVWYYATKKDWQMRSPSKVLVQDKIFLAQPDVRPPTINGHYLLEHSHVNEGEEVLDIGTGSGIHAIFAAEKAKHIVATDIYAPAINNAKTNAKLNGVEDKIDFRVGDLFGPVKDDEKFDVIYLNINLPFAIDNKDRINLHERFFAEVHKHMKPDARIYYQTSFVKNISQIYDMLSRNGFRIMEMHMEHMADYDHEPLFMMIKTLNNQQSSEKTNQLN